MSNEFTEADWEKLNNLMLEQQRWANLTVTIEEIARENKVLIRDLARYEPVITVSLLSSLLTLPELQSHCIRLEILVTLAVVHCRGRKRANIKQVIEWFSQIGDSRCVVGEDPAEDVFVSLVQDHQGDYRLIEGIWEAAGFYTQRVLDVIATMPDNGKFRQIKRSVHSLLMISDLICEKAGLHRYQLGSDELYSTLPSQVLPRRNVLISRITITFAELDAHGINVDDVKPFFFQPQMRKDLSQGQIGRSRLDRYPLILHGTKHLTVVLPTALSIALRDYVIERIINDGLVEAFDDELAHNYSRLFFDTPLLGGLMRAPVIWRKSDTYQWSYLHHEIDEGYFVSFHFFLPSIQLHPQGGFKSNYQDEGDLAETLQTSINEVLEYFDSKDDFREGIIVLVGCGWGKGYATEVKRLDHPHWHLESMSAADLVRLSWLGDMNPGYFWRIKEGLKIINKAGVQIVNPNGILNLIGWIRSNDGHFVPHAQLPEGKISPESPLMLQLPLNLLREVRADSDHGYDRHSTVDNTGTWHNVQHTSPNPFFSNKSSRRIYASMDAVRRRKLTAVYEGAFTLWVSITAPNIPEKEIEYRLWEMAKEWLHRIGNVIDERDSFTKKQPLKVYIEFHDDDSVKEAKEIPTLENLLPLCKIEPHSERNACKVIFQAGFLAGARIAENIVERLFVRTLARAYLHLLGVEDCEGEAEAVENFVVPNDDARSFHLFHTQRFMDYVLDMLPEDLILLDSVEDATAKIGLGWRVLEKGQSNKLEGKEICTDFLQKVINVLLAEIFEMLIAFDRLSTLTRLVANCEKANAEEYHWKRTSAAILGLHGNEPNSADRYVEQLSKFAGAHIASRILIEIALCICPLGKGQQISDIELSKLIARASLLFRYGGISDAIYYNAVAPEITISSLGDILFRNEFGRMVVDPMLSQVFGDRFVANAPMQRKNYENPEVIPETKGNISNEFLNIWNIEMGFDLDEARNIIEALEDKGLDYHAAIFTIKQSEYLTLVCSDNVLENSARMFLEQFSLTTRPQWDKPPKGFNPKDLYPWRFGRRLSFVARPILRVDDNDDPILLIAPGALRRGFGHVVDGAYSGRLPQTFFRSKEMRNTWWGKASEGHTFNAEVAKALGEAGWQVRENIGLPEILNRKIEQDYGDVDVLAWRPDRKEVLIIECKDLSLARNYSEIAALLSDYQGIESEKESDKLRRHLNRVEFLQDNCGHLQRFTRVQEIQVVSCLVFSDIVPMQYAKINALINTRVGKISDILEI